jgi:transglutaminase-like putative cysteine protease
MKLNIRHSTIYSYEVPGGQLVQRFHLTPVSGPTQTVIDWSVEAPGIDKALSYTDAFGNVAQLVTANLDESDIEVVAQGTVETRDTAGVVGANTGHVPLGAYLSETPVTLANAAIRALGRRHEGTQGLQQLHDLMSDVRDAIEYEIGASHAHTTAAEALKDGAGVCQDHAHVFISAARTLGIPARYVSGYMATSPGEVAEASHAWAEAHVPELGWVGFDVANRVCPDERYVRVAVAMDVGGARPVKGIRRGLGHAGEHLRVEVLVDPAAEQ